MVTNTSSPGGVTLQGGIHELGKVNESQDQLTHNSSGLPVQ